MNGSVQDCNASIADALEILQSYTKPSICMCACVYLSVYVCVTVNPGMIIARTYGFSVFDNEPIEAAVTQLQEQPLVQLSNTNRK